MWFRRSIAMALILIILHVFLNCVCLCWQASHLWCVSALFYGVSSPLLCSIFFVVYSFIFSLLCILPLLCSPPWCVVTLACVLLVGVCLHLSFMPSNLVPLTVKYLWLHASVSLMYFLFLVLWNSLYVLSIAFMHTPGCRIVRLGSYGLGRHTRFSKAQIIEEKT